MSILKKSGRLLYFLTLTMLFMVPFSGVAQQKDLKERRETQKRLRGPAGDSLLNGKTRVHSRASVAHRGAPWGCDPFSRCGK